LVRFLWGLAFTLDLDFLILM